jgi:undecaprenyl-diphosphatase
MSIFQAILLGIVEGITEFLPISSTAHLMMAAKVFNIPQTDFLKSFEIVIQLGAIASVALVFGRKILSNPALIKKVIIGFLPTAVVGFVLYAFIRNYLIDSLSIAAWSLIIGGIILILIEKAFLKHKTAPGHELESITNRQAFIIGVIQSLAVIPGVSRAAATIVPALFLGASRKAAAEFSFLLAVPTIGAAAVYELVRNFTEINGNAGPMIAGFITSFIAAALTIKFFLSFIQKHSFVPFGVYRIIVAVLFLLLFV